MITKSILGENKEFNSEKEMIDFVKSNVEQIIDFKRGSIQKSIDKGQSVTCRPLKIEDIEPTNKAVKMDADHYYIVVNTTRILDSHGDVHIDGLWNKTVIDQQGRNYLVDTHSLSLGATIVRKEHIEMFLAKVSFASLGLSYQGSTEAFIYKFPKNKVIDSKAKEWLESGDAIEASVKMQYIKLVFCLDSKAPEDEQAKAHYDNYIKMVANRKDFESIPYFFAILEGKNVMEASLCPFGSNGITGNILPNKDIEPSNDTQNNDNHTNEPTKVTQQKSNFKLNQFFN